eukprot:g32239.t1
MQWNPMRPQFSFQLCRRVPKIHRPFHTGYFDQDYAARAEEVLLFLGVRGTLWQTTLLRIACMQLFWMSSSRALGGVLSKIQFLVAILE